MVNLNPLALVAGAARLAERVVTLYATEGRDILHNTPDGWEVDRPAIWWLGPPEGGDPVWGNPPPGADGSGVFASLPAVTRCTSIIADTVAGLPWHVVRGDYEQLSTPDWILDPQALRLDGRVASGAGDLAVKLSAVEFWANWIISALWLGDGYVYVPVRDSAGQPKPPLWQFHPADVSIVEGRYEVAGEPIDPAALLHLRGFGPYWGGTGGGVITRHYLDLGLAVTTRTYTEGQYHSGVPAGYLQSTQPHLEESEALDLKRAWLAQHGGSRRSIAVLNATTSFNPIQLTPLDSALDVARQWSLRDVALAFGVAPYMLGVPGDSSTYANVESRMIELRAFTLLPWVRRIESTLDAQFPRGTTLKIKTAGLERADTKTRYDAYAVGINAGFLTPDDVRSLEDMPPLDTPAPPPPSPVPTPPPPPPVASGIPNATTQPVGVPA
jgi:HK97 family phage portal protein